MMILLICCPVFMVGSMLGIVLVTLVVVMVTLVVLMVTLVVLMVMVRVGHRLCVSFGKRCVEC